MELHLSFLRLQGQANDFKIQYNSVVRLFILPKVGFFGFFNLHLSVLLTAHNIVGTEELGFSFSGIYHQLGPWTYINHVYL